MKTLKHILSLLILLSFSCYCLGQTVLTPDWKNINESLIAVTDTVIKKEIATFTVKGASLGKLDSVLKSKMIEIPLNGCNDSIIVFEKGDIISLKLGIWIKFTKFDTIGHKFTYDSTNNHILFIDDKPFWGTDGGMPQKKIKRITFSLYTFHNMHDFPDYALAGIYQPNYSCNTSSKGKSKVKPTSTYCKVFRSADKRRVYIYMSNGDGAGSYEVTWVIQDSKYYTRVVDITF